MCLADGWKSVAVEDIWGTTCTRNVFFATHCFTAGRPLQSANRYIARPSGEHSAGVAEVVVGLGEAGGTQVREN